jgi:calcineurin-like phosphoesterase family protein
MIYLISDEHYFHEKIIQYCTRPFKDTKEYQYNMIKWHNEIVTSDDTVYHLGDFALTDNWKQVQTILNKLNGNHHLIIGNHDWLYIWNYIEAGFQSVHTSFQLEDFTLIHDPAVAGVLRDKKWIHGHTHGLGRKLNNNSYCVSVEISDYRPVSFDYVKENFSGIIQEREFLFHGPDL